MSILFIPPSASDSSWMALDTFPPKISDRFYMNWVLFYDNKNCPRGITKCPSKQEFQKAIFSTSNVNVYISILSDRVGILSYCECILTGFLSYCEQLYGQMDRQTNHRQSGKFIWVFSSGELKRAHTVQWSNNFNHSREYALGKKRTHTQGSSKWSH